MDFLDRRQTATLIAGTIAAPAVARARLTRTIFIQRDGAGRDHDGKSTGFAATNVIYRNNPASIMECCRPRDVIIRLNAATDAATQKQEIAKQREIDSLQADIAARNYSNRN